jgi:hypothetical protein
VKLTRRPDGGSGRSEVAVHGDRSVGQAINAQVVIGDHNVVLRVDGRDLVEVPVPATVEDAERLLFAGTGASSSRLVGSWLRPEAGVVAEQPRPEAAELTAWCQSPGEPVVRLVCGAGGQGKTFLAQQVCRGLRNHGWLAGMVGMPPVNWQSVTAGDVVGANGGQAWRALRRVPELVAAVRGLIGLRVRALLVVDYAEHVGPMVAELLDTVVGAGGQDLVRVLLLARSPQGWWRALAEEHPLHGWVDAQPTVLGSLDARWDAARVQAVWAQAVAAFAAQARLYNVPAAADPAGEVVPERFDTTLDLYAHALLRVLDIGHTESREAGDAVAGVLAHEHRQVSTVLHAAGVAWDEACRDWAIAATILRPAPDLAFAAAALQAVPVLANMEPVVLNRATVALGRAYPHPSGQAVWGAPRPDRLADTHMLRMATDAPSDRDWVHDLQALCGSDDPAVADVAGVALHRCLSTPGASSTYPTGLARVEGALRALITDWPGGYVPVITVVDPERFTGDIVAAVEDPRMAIGQVERLDALLYGMGFATTRTRVAVAVSQRLVGAHHPGHQSNPATLNRYATSLNNLSIRLGDLGRREEGLAAIEEAVDAYRRLAGANPAAYLPDLATSLNNLSADLGDLGRHEDAARAAEDAAAAGRHRLATDDKL